MHERTRGVPESRARLFIYSRNRAESKKFNERDGPELKYSISKVSPPSRCRTSSAVYLRTESSNVFDLARACQ